MAAGAPWSVKGIDPKARAIAKSAARSEGMTLGEWLNRVIIEDKQSDSESAWEYGLSDFPGLRADHVDLPKFSSNDHQRENRDDLNEMIDRLADKLEAVENRSSKTFNDIDESVLSLKQRLDSLEIEHDESEDLAVNSFNRLKNNQSELLDRLQNIEKSGTIGASRETVKGLEKVVSKLASHLYQTERDVKAELTEVSHNDTRRRQATERALKTLGEELTQTEEKLKQETHVLKDVIEAKSSQFNEDLGTAMSLGETLSSRLDHAETLARRATQTLIDSQDSLDQRLQSVENHNSETANHVLKTQNITNEIKNRVAQAETNTQKAVEALVRNQETLDRRLRSVEAEPQDALKSQDFQRQFEQLNKDLNALVQETRQDCARQIAEMSVKLAEGKSSDQVDQVFKAAESRLNETQNRQNDAINRISEEVIRLSSAIDNRISEAERRLETKYNDADSRRDHRDTQNEIEAQLSLVRIENQDALRQMGEQVTRLGENLANRVDQAEQRSASAVEAAGERMAKIIEKLGSNQDGLSQVDLDQRIKSSEERTALHIDNALEQVHKRLDESSDAAREALSPVQRALSTLSDRLESIEQSSTLERESLSDTITQEAAPAPPPSQTPSVEKSVWDTNIDAQETPQDRFFAQAQHQEPQDQIDTQSWEIGADYSSRIGYDDTQAYQPEPHDDNHLRLGATADADFLGHFRERSAQYDETNYQAQASSGAPASSRIVRKALIGLSVLGLVAILSTVGILVLESNYEPSQQITDTSGAQEPTQALTTLFSDYDANAEVVSDSMKSTQVQSSAPSSQTFPSTSAPERIVEAEPPQIRVEAQRVTLEQAAGSGNPIARYQLAISLAKQGRSADSQALMRRAAEQGIPDAMRRYGQSLVDGENASVNRDAALAWMVRSAQAGNVIAMHEAGSLYISSDELQAQEQAAHWFEQAASYGHHDSQFNVALLYREGFGVERSITDAYAWFSIAAKSGDIDASNRANEIASELSADQRQAADQVISGFQARNADPEVQGNYPDQVSQTSPEDMINRTQTLLGQLGYDPGPADGVMGVRTRRAIVKYQQDTGLMAGGPLNAALIAQLERAAS